MRCNNNLNQLSRGSDKGDASELHGRNEAKFSNVCERK